MRYYNVIKSFICFSVFMFFAVSLASYSSQDPSFDRATNIDTTNLAGNAGAYVADFILQIVSWSGAIVILLMPLCWTFVYLRHNKVSYWFLRLIAGLIAASSASILINKGVVAKLFYVNLTMYNNALIDSIGYVVFFASLYFCLALPIDVWKWLLGKIFSCIPKNFPSWLKFNKSRKIPEIVDLKKVSPIQKIIAVEKVNSLFPPKKPQSIKTAVNSDVIRNKNGFMLPSTDLLKEFSIDKDNVKQNNSVIKGHKEELQQVLSDFGVVGEIIGAYAGPVVTLYEIEPSAGTKSSRVIGLSDDISRSMRAVSARIAVIPGRNAIGIELPNKQREMVYLKELLESEEYRNKKHDLPIILGKDISGNAIVVDLAKMPHLLVAGTTGSGKSVAINTMILSLLYSLTPEQCKFIMVDPKMLELSVYDGIPHLLTNVVTEPGKAVVAMKWVVKEMENRYRLMSNLAVRNVHNYNERIKEAISKGEVIQRTVHTGFDADTGKPKIEQVPLDMKILPFIVVIVDEMADLMLVAGKDIETSIQRLAQMARAAGIHIIMATQRPSVDVITGVIKANFPTRISFQVTSKIDSRTILGEQGAEQLLGKGDMLYMAGGSKITRVHGPFVDDKEVERVVSFLKEQGQPDYITDIVSEDFNAEGGTALGGSNSESDELYNRAIEIVQLEGRASTSFIQRSLKIGYNRAANIMDQMEKEGVVSKPNHVGKREILM